MYLAVASFRYWSELLWPLGNNAQIEKQFMCIDLWTLTPDDVGLNDLLKKLVMYEVPLVHKVHTASTW